MRKMHIHVLAMLLTVGILSCSHEVQHDHAKMLADEKRNNSIDTSLSIVVKSPAQTVISSQEVVKPVISSASLDNRVEGYVTIDPRRNEKVAVRFGGRIEKLYVRYDFQYVLKGEKIMEIYSPELITAEEEYVYILSSGRDTALARIAREKLLLLGMTQEQVTRLTDSHTITETIAVYSPYEGYVKLETKEQQTQSGVANPDIPVMAQMNVIDQTQVAVQGSDIIREGSYVTKGQTLFVINDYKKVWVMLASPAIYPVGTAVQMISEQQIGTVINGSIDFVEPVFSAGQKFSNYRVYLDNAERKLTLNTLITAQVISQRDTRLELPASCVLALGQRKIVWLKTGTTSGGSGIFEAHNVTTGSTSGGQIEIISGLTVNDEVARSAGFMIDSQSLINAE